MCVTWCLEGSGDVAVDLAKSVYQVAELVRVGQVSQRKRLTRAVFEQFIHEQAVPVEWVNVNNCMGGAKPGRTAAPSELACSTN